VSDGDQGGPLFVDDTHERIHGFAEEFLDEEEREEFVDGLLDRLGYVKVSSWGPAPAQQGGGQRAPLVRPRQQQGGRQRAPQRPAAGAGDGGGGQQRRGSYFR
jgi:hypothetical protein